MPSAYIPKRWRQITKCLDPKGSNVLTDKVKEHLKKEYVGKVQSLKDSTLMIHVFLDRLPMGKELTLGDLSKACGFELATPTGSKPFKLCIAWLMKSGCIYDARKDKDSTELSVGEVNLDLFNDEPTDDPAPIGDPAPAPTASVEPAPTASVEPAPTASVEPAPTASVEPQTSTAKKRKG